jgi:NAD(P)-dependent dehydrogenase (short-subunit alcohol dehydrogenase family)
MENAKKAAIVTGASLGIGKGIAFALAEKGRRKGRFSQGVLR